MTWGKEAQRLKCQQNLAKEMGGDTAIAKQHSRGRLTMRERIDKLLDTGSFHEIGSIAGKAGYDNNGNPVSFTHVARVPGHGRIGGRPVCVEGGDFTIKGGWADPTRFVSIGGFTPEKMALEWRMPFVRLLDSAGGSVERIEEYRRNLAQAVIAGHRSQVLEAKPFPRDSTLPLSCPSPYSTIQTGVSATSRPLASMSCRLTAQLRSLSERLG